MSGSVGAADLDKIQQRHAARRAAFDRVLAEARALDPALRDELVLTLAQDGDDAAVSPIVMHIGEGRVLKTLRSAVEFVLADGRSRTTGELFLDVLKVRPSTKRASMGAEVARLTEIGVLTKNKRGTRPKYTLATKETPS
ncbi:MAG TPA: hypothetical protein VHE35_08865 [Kofleriaceae bacterium]|nr:hypothetical protein [Kofleriaceae bacterium]